MKKIKHYEEIQYLYESEEQKFSHSKDMESQGYEDSGRYSMNINHSLSNPENVLCGIYYRYIN